MANHPSITFELDALKSTIQILKSNQNATNKKLSEKEQELKYLEEKLSSILIASEMARLEFKNLKEQLNNKIEENDKLEQLNDETNKKFGR